LNKILFEKGKKDEENDCGFSFDGMTKATNKKHKITQDLSGINHKI
jgi:hypothetical protein